MSLISPQPLIMLSMTGKVNRWMHTINQLNSLRLSNHAIHSILGGVSHCRSYTKEFLELSGKLER